MKTDKKLTVNSFRRMKRDNDKIVMLTAADAPMANLAASCGIDIILVGDSLAMTVLGYENTLPLTLDESLHHSAAVRRGAPKAFIVGDMPFMTYQADINDALVNAARYLKEARADAIKLEGGMEVIDTVTRFTGAGIPVMGHIGLQPQKVMTAGGYRIAGKSDAEIKRLLEEAVALQRAGAFAVVLECIPAEVSRQITAALDIPTIGIGAGVNCDGQVQVVNDLLGFFTDFVPKHAKRYANLTGIIKQAFAEYVSEVKAEDFPAAENSF